jgi:hypothetical protein
VHLSLVWRKTSDAEIIHIIWLTASAAFFSLEFASLPTNKGTQPAQSQTSTHLFEIPAQMIACLGK